MHRARIPPLDGDQCIAECDGDDNLFRKYVYGPGIDQPVRMIDVEDSGPALSLSNGAVSYYHYDGLGSVVALSDEEGDTIQVYEYNVYGNVAASDPNHTNPFLFTGRRLDPETGLYFYRARYYNPALGRFLQTDPIGYGDGMNMYAYCGNNPGNAIDPLGLRTAPVEPTKVCITVGELTEDGLFAIDFNLLESVDDWLIRRDAWDMESILQEIDQLNNTFESYELSIQGLIPSNWNFGEDAVGSIYASSEGNPVVQILQHATNAVKIDWRNIVIGASQLTTMAAVLDYSGSTAENTFVVDTGLGQYSEVSGTEIIIDDLGEPRGQEVGYVVDGGPDADYNIYGAVYSFTRDGSGAFTYVKTWEWSEGNAANNRLQPY